jgi:uncharacterized protein YacL
MNFLFISVHYPFFISKKYLFLGTNMPCCTSINLCYSRLLIKLTLEIMVDIQFQDFIYEVTNLYDINVNNPFLRVSLQTYIFIIFNLVSNLITNELFYINLLAVPFPFTSNVFLWVLVGFLHLFHYVYLRDHSERVDSSFE